MASFENGKYRSELKDKHELDEVDVKDADLDVGAQLVASGVAYTDAEEKAVRRRIDWYLMPLCAWACGLQYVDKTALGAAATYGISTDLKFQGNQYSWAVSIFYFGYLVGSPIMTRLLQYFHSGKVVGLSFFLWGITLLGTTWATNFEQVAAMRFLLGVFEAALAPGLLLITTMYYTQREQPARFGYWTLLNGLLPIPFIVIYWGLGHVTTGPLSSWRLIFLLVGLISVLTGVSLFFLLPDSPATCWFLNERQRQVAVERMNRAQTGVKNTHLKWPQVWEALTDWRVWLIVLQMLFCQAVGAVQSNFLGIIIKGLGYTALNAQLLTAPNFAIQFVTCLLVCFPPTYLKRFKDLKQPLVATASIGAIIGVIIFKVSNASDSSARLAGVMLLSMNGASYTVVMSVVGANVTGFTKKQVATSMVFIAYCVIAICTPQAFLAREAPAYPTGLTFCLVLAIAFVITAWISWLVMRIENKRRDKLALTDPDYATGDDNQDHLSGLRDHTERENGHFRYSG